MIASIENYFPTVAVVDDDESVREALDSLLRSVGHRVALFAGAQEFIASGIAEKVDCLVLDVRLPGRSGLDLQEFLGGANFRQPVVFFSGHADVAMSVRAMKAGAMEFFTKPVREQDLLDAVQRAVQLGQTRRRDAEAREKLSAKYRTLTPREREVLTWVVSGRRNKQIAADIGVTEATVKLHRANIMQKLQASTLVDLVRVSDALRSAENAP